MLQKEFLGVAFAYRYGYNTPMERSLYVHIPFCKRKCIYCNFYSDIYDEVSAGAYVDVLTNQLNKLDGPFGTIYIGGGTPTILSPALLKRLMSGLSRFAKPSVEFTVEANPDSVDETRLKILSEHGANRISIGVQSLRDEKLKKLGRIHNVRRAIESVETARRAGFSNITIDLIFGVWGEKAADWKGELEEAVRLPVKHISCYELTYESSTPLFAALQNKTIKVPDTEMSAQMYEMAIDALSLRDFKQYEVSNFALKGFESKHNENYWANGAYLGLGASAFSYDGEVRSKNVSDAGEYMRRVSAGLALCDFSEKLPPEKRAKETAAVKIRTKDGINFGWFKEKTGFDFLTLEKKALPKLIEDGFIKYLKEKDVVTGICLKRKGFLFCDTVSSGLL